jgi:alpha-glucosidase
MLTSNFRLGDNLSQWDKYRVSISEMLAFASIFQVPMVGSDVCGFGGNTTEELCARWATLGAFYPFYRNHNQLGSIDQEFYRWPVVADAARKIIDIRYRLLDYLYTAFHRQTQTGEPFLQPLFYLYPNDANTFSNEGQFFYGDSLLISPVLEEGSTSVDAYFPQDTFYDWTTGARIDGQGQNITLSNIDLTDIPMHIRAGSIIPLRSKGAMTTKELRTRGFEIVIAPNNDHFASGELYLDDGESLKPTGTSQIQFTFSENKLHIRGDFGYQGNVVIETVTLLGQKSAGSRRNVDGVFDDKRQALTKTVNVPLDGEAVIQL